MCEHCESKWWFRLVVFLWVHCWIRPGLWVWLAYLYMENWYLRFNLWLMGR